MKKSEMIKHISAVMYDAYVDRQHSRETEDAYWNRHAAQLLDMMLGFGMLPPLYNMNEGSGMPSDEVNEWEQE
jgi:hypothetical protein